MTDESSFERYSQPREMDLESVGQGGFTTLFAIGIVNPMGPTMNALAADGLGPAGERQALLHIILNPFSQECYKVGSVNLGGTWSPLRDLRAFFSLPFGSCPTLLMPSALYSDECAQHVFVELLQSFDDGNETWHKLRHFPGDPWKRVKKEMERLPDFIASSLKEIQTQEQPRRLTTTEAGEFVELQLDPKNLVEEFKAFMFAWEGSINFSGLGRAAMSKDRFLETFGRLALTLRSPLMSNIIDNPEILGNQTTKKGGLGRLFGRRPADASTRSRSHRGETEEHPLMRIARSKYSEGSIEQTLVLRFLNARSIAKGITGKDHSVMTQRLLMWAQDARSWAEQLLKDDPQNCTAMFEQVTEESIQSVRELFRQELGPDPGRVDDLAAAEALMSWSTRRGFELSENRVRLCEFVVEVVDASLWLGWLFPRGER